MVMRRLAQRATKQIPFHRGATSEWRGRGTTERPGYLLDLPLVVTSRAHIASE